MIGARRTQVLWFGSKASSNFKEHLDRLGGLQLIPVANEIDLAESLATARAVIFEFDGDLAAYIARIRRTRDLAMQNGVLIGLLNGEGLNPEDFQLAANRAFADAADAKSASFGPESRSVRPIRDFHRDLSLAVHEISRWQPGPSFSQALKIKIKGRPKKRYYNTAHERLLRRGFSDFKSIEVRILMGGASGAGVYCVTPSKQPWAPFLAKVDTTDHIAAETDRFTKYVNRTVSFNHRPNFDADRTVYTPGLSILVEDFIERAKPIYDVLPHSTPAVLISSIFEGALRNWRRESRSDNMRISHTPLEKILGRRTQAFFDAANYAKEKLKCPFNGDELLSACNAFHKIRCTWSRIHGDLHAGNIYVGSNSPDVILIDFSKTEEGPSVLDPACLEVDILFNGSRFKRPKAVSEGLIRKLYQVPLHLPSVHALMSSQNLWILDAVRAIRMFGLGDMDRPAYTLALACYLVQYASFEDNGTARSRAFATCIAAQLVKWLSDEEK